MIYLLKVSHYHSFKSLVISSIYILPDAPDDQKENIFTPKNDLIKLYMESIMLELIILPFLDQVYSLYSLVISTVSFSVRW